MGKRYSMVELKIINTPASVKRSEWKRRKPTSAVKSVAEMTTTTLPGSRRRRWTVHSSRTASEASVEVGVVLAPPDSDPPDASLLLWMALIRGGDLLAA
jgi:hypothetical protein